MGRWLMFIATLLLITSCKIRMDVPEGGVVTTASGTYNCNSGDVCEIDVVDIFFDETFIAEPSDGYYFKHWQLIDRGLCGGRSDPCRLATSGFEGNDALMNILESDDVFHLNPVFERLEECAAPVAEPQ